ncbi:hypothetical protein SASPL_111991 [Salvia splendens]|uniref:Proteinase inhibitor I13, potato inhibitor I n=1 Tax=Salvia splendens TaxID=180675 RepID=A0A8X8Y9Y3_SALSN|nr:hypothetical protein SASPL_111991 [Salvia splendens]
MLRVHLQDNLRRKDQVQFASFCKKDGHKKNDCEEYHAWRVKKEQDDNLVIPVPPPEQQHEEQPQLPQEHDEVVPLRRSTRVRRPAISTDEYIVYLQEHEVDIGVMEDDPVTFRQAIERKGSWPELVGASGKEGAKVIEKENSLVYAIIVFPDQSIIIGNFNYARVWVFVDYDGIVTSVPMID